MGLFSLFSNDDAEQAAAQKKAGLQQGYDALSTNYSQGRDALTTNYGTASNLWGNLVNSSNAGANAYSDASGANGSDGLQRADATFKNSGQYGAYGFSLDQGLQALNRTHAAAGNLNSGNADADSMKYASGLANSTYGSYLSGLQPYLGQQATATAGAAGVDTGLGTALDSSFRGQGAAANANYTGQGSADAAATMNNYAVGNNILGAIGTGASLLSGAGGYTSGLKSLFSGFGGGATPGAYGGGQGGSNYSIGYGGQMMPVY